MPFPPGEVRIDLACGRREDGHWWGFFDIRITAEALRRLGLHPDQPTSRIVGPAQPGWWRADALRRLGGLRRRGPSGRRG
jgi:hypothetical protein